MVVAEGEEAWMVGMVREVIVAAGDSVVAAAVETVLAVDAAVAAMVEAAAYPVAEMVEVAAYPVAKTAVLLACAAARLVRRGRVVVAAGAAGSTRDSRAPCTRSTQHSSCVYLSAARRRRCSTSPRQC